MQGRRNQKLPLSMLAIGRYPVRVCRTVHHCELCGKAIVLGERYRDGGYSRRCHESCADRGGFSEQGVNDSATSFGSGKAK